MDKIEEIKPNTPIILFTNNDNEERSISVTTTNTSKSKQCFIELFIDQKDGGNRKSVFRRMLNCGENATADSHHVGKNEKYFAIVSHCEVEIRIK